MGEATVTAEVRRTGADSAEASISQRLTVEALPEEVITASGATLRTATLPTTTRAGTPGFVPSISFYDVEARSFKVRWGTPSDGGRPLTGFGLLLWTGSNQPAYSSAHVVGGSVRSHHYGGKDPSTTYKFRIHACNGTDSCGYWTNPPKEVTTDSTATPTPTATPTSPPDPVRPPGPVKNLSFTKDRHSFTVNWTAPDDDGGTTIKGYGILQWRDGSSRPAYSKATTVSGTSKTYSGLNEDTTYWVKVHACNGPDSCGPWTADTSVRTTKNSTPPVTGLGVTAGKNSLTIAWTAPSPPAGTTLGGYTVQHRRQGTAWPSGSEAPPATATSWTITGLINGTPTDVQIQACYGSAGCSDWKAISGIPGNKVGNARIEVAKTTIDIGERLQVTIYDVPVGEVAYVNMYGSIQPEGRCPGRTRDVAPRRVGEPSTGGWYDSFRIDGCPDGGVGYIRVTNADESELYASVTITVNRSTPPNPPEPIQTQAPVALHPVATCGTHNDGSPSKPTNLNVLPISGRRAVITWDGTTTATSTPADPKYIVELRQAGSAPWPTDMSLATANILSAARPCITINLDKVLEPDNVTGIPSTDMGFADAPGFAIRVKPFAGDKSTYSEVITIIDTPITHANGDSRNAVDGPGMAQLHSTPINTILGSIYGSGRLQLRLRFAFPDHMNTSWSVDSFSSNFRHFDNISLPATIGKLELNALYAIQLVFDTNNSGVTDVFAARYAYVWTSVNPPTSGDVVGGIPFQYPLESKEFLYRICERTFPSAQREAWVKMTRHALRQWSVATNGLLSLVHDSYTAADFVDEGLPSDLSGKGKPCFDYTGLIGDVVAAVTPIVSKHGYSTDKARKMIHDAARSVIDAGIVQAKVDFTRNEILMFDDSSGGQAEYLKRVTVFPEFAGRVGYLWCWTDTATIACAHAIENPKGDGRQISLSGEAWSLVILLQSQGASMSR